MLVLQEQHFAESLCMNLKWLFAEGCLYYGIQQRRGCLGFFACSFCNASSRSARYGFGVWFSSCSRNLPAKGAFTEIFCLSCSMCWMESNLNIKATVKGTIGVSPGVTGKNHQLCILSLQCCWSKGFRLMIIWANLIVVISIVFVYFLAIQYHLTLWYTKSRW